MTVRSYKLGVSSGQTRRLSDVYGGYADLVRADGAVAYWRLGETSGTTAVDQVGGANGTISGGVTLGQSGALADGDKAMAFDGATGQIVTALSLAIPTNCTLEAWVKTSAATAQQPAISNTPGTGRVYFGLINGELFLHSPGATPVSVNTSAAFTANNQWHHIVAVLTPTQTELYKDGVSILTAAQTKAATAASVVEIGSDVGYTNERWNGSLDEVAIYPTALTASQIATHYAARTVVPTSLAASDVPYRQLSLLASAASAIRIADAPLSYPAQVVADGAVAYWRLGETSGSTAVDQIGGANGTISGGVTLGQAGALADGDKAMAFNGPAATGKIETLATLLFPATCTVELWFRCTGGAQQDLLSHRKNVGDMVCGVLSNKFYTFGPSGIVSSVGTVTDGAWHQGVLAFTGANLSIYLDGSVDSSVAYVRTGATDVVTLAWDGPGAAWLAGSLDEVAIYPIALTPAQIAAHYAARTVARGTSAPGMFVPASPIEPLLLGPFDTGPLRLSDLYASGDGTLQITGVPF